MPNANKRERNRAVSPRMSKLYYAKNIVYSILFTREVLTYLALNLGFREGVGMFAMYVRKYGQVLNRFLFEKNV